MDFSRTPAEIDLYDSVVRFSQNELGDRGVDRDHRREFPRDLWARCADFGVLKWTVPEKLGGSGHTATTIVHLMEGLGYGCRDNGLSFGLGTQVWGIQHALLHFGTEQQVAAYLPGSMDGTLVGAYALNEEGSGSDALGIDTTAAKDGDGYVLNGEKALVTFAPIADFAITFAVTDPAAGRWGISAFLVEADTPGFTAQPAESWMGLRTIPFGRITFTDCHVPGRSLLGTEGAGASIFAFSQALERSFVLAPQLGAMQRLIDECVEVGRRRVRGGTPVGKHQAVSHKVTDMKLRLETARLLLYKTAWLHEQGQSNLMEAALAKIYLSEAFVQSSLDAIMIHGGDGYKSDTAIERNLRDAIGGTIHGGTVDVQRNIVSRLLGL